MFTRSTSSRSNKNQRRRAKSSGKRRIQRPRRLGFLEALESRNLLSVSWTGLGGDTNWHTPGNWSGGETPTSADDVIIDSPAVTVNILTGDTVSIKSLTLASADGLSISGGSLSVSAASVLSGSLAMTGGSLRASGSGIALTANGSTTISGASLYAENGATLSLPNLTTYNSNFTTLQAQGEGSVLDLSALTTITETESWSINAYSGGEVDLTGLTSLTSAYHSTITDSGGSTILNANLTSLNGIDALLDGTDTHVADAWTSLTNGLLEVTVGSYSLAGLTNVDGSSLQVLNGATLSLPNLTTYDSSFTTLQAQGEGSVLDLSALTTITETESWSINAYDGGEIDLTGLTSLTSAYHSTITDTGSSTILNANLTSLDGVDVYLDGTDTHVADSWSSLTNGLLKATGGSYTLTALVDVDGSSLYAWSGATLRLSNLTHFESNYDIFEADGDGSVLDLSALASFTQIGDWTINAFDGGIVILPGLTGLSGGKGITINITGGGAIQAGNLTTLDGVVVNLDGTDTTFTDSWTTLTNSSLIVVDSTCGLANLTEMTDSFLTVDAAGVLALPTLSGLTATNCAITLNAGGTLTVDGHTMSVPASGSGGAVNVPVLIDGVDLIVGTGTFTDTVVFNVVADANLSLVGGTYTGGATFNVAAGATVDLTGGATTTYGGTLTGAGDGAVQLTDGFLHAATGGVILDFSDSVFQWTDGIFTCDVGNVTNLGTMNLVGDEDKYVDNDGTLTNQGTIVQTSGAATLNVTGSLNNTGTIEVDAGTLSLTAGSVVQIDGTTLTGGTWKALNGATLQLPVGTAIESNAGNVTLGGSGATITGLTGLADNSGDFAVIDGATFTTASDFANSGTVTIGVESTIDVTGNSTQTADGTFVEQIGGSQASGLYGTMAVTGTATVGGTFHLDLVGGYVPSGDQDYPVISFSDVSGSFAQATGLNPYFIASLGSTSFDLVTSPVVSSVAALPAIEYSKTFTVSWSGEAASGIASYDVYVSDNSGAFALWQSATTQTSASYTGVAGHAYGFYSIATDNEGHVESTPSGAQATTTVDATALTVTVNRASTQASPTNTSPIKFTVVFNKPVVDFVAADVTLTGTAGATTVVVTGSGATYTVAVSNMGGVGTVIASLAAGVAHDAAGNANAASTSTANSVTYRGLTVGSVAICEASTPRNGVLESNENLKITWAARSPNAIVSQTLTIDGKAVTPISGPFSSLYFSCLIGKRSIGSHSYTIKAKDSKGITSTRSGTFTVVAPVPPAITHVAIVQATTTTSAGLAPNVALKMTWASSSQHGIASQTLTIDGRTITPIKGPYSGLYYSCAIGKYSAGSHSYTIKATDRKGVSSRTSGTFVVGASSLAIAPSSAPNEQAETITEAQLAATVAEAVRRFEQQLGVQAETLMAGLNVQVANLPSGTLGETLGHTIWIDDDGAGCGWFVDPTPADDAEFVGRLTSGSLSARKDTPAATRVDLLTTIMHEIGHVLGGDDVSSDGLMNGVLSTGTRRTVAVDQVFATLRDE
jgi:hypothetical protein